MNQDLQEALNESQGASDDENVSQSMIKVSKYQNVEHNFVGTKVSKKQNKNKAEQSNKIKVDLNINQVRPSASSQYERFFDTLDL